MGKQVGNGQCTALAKYALEAAGAKPRQNNADFPSGGWGRLVLFLDVTERGPKETGSRRDIKPGDIIQWFFIADISIIFRRKLKEINAVPEGGDIVSNPMTTNSMRDS